MTRLLLAWLAAAALLAAGCAPTPERPTEGDRFAFRSASTPYAAAICIARNARARDGMTAEERTVGSSSTEVIVRTRDGEPLAVARVDNDGIFSNVSVLVAPAVRSGHAEFARRLMEGCGR